MKIGITERGDAGRDLRWTCSINTVDGAILITKALTPDFIKAVIACKKPIIIHATCTGYGGTELEPNVPASAVQLNNLAYLIKEAGFPASRVVLRIDPIFPSDKGIAKAKAIIDRLLEMNLGVTRVRLSIVDEYKHVKKRYEKRGWKPLYNGFYASKEQVQKVVELLREYKDTQLSFETCAEPVLVRMAHESGVFNISESGCISKADLFLMDLPDDGSATVNPQNRSGCKCLSYKTELLTDKTPCVNGCIYCFWQNKGQV